jgi:hypothetical protein
VSKKLSIRGIGLVRLRIGIRIIGGALWLRQWTSGFHELWSYLVPHNKKLAPLISKWNRRSRNYWEVMLSNCIYISLSPLSLATDATLGVSGLWLGTRTGAGGTVTLVWNFFGRSPHGSMDNRNRKLYLAFSSWLIPEV